jgi:ElaB/YqjD/DUF883 family membrane-anchored ribosome-binding protein
MAKTQGTWNNVKRRWEAVNDRMHDVQERTTDYMSDNPVKSALITFGIGVLAGAIIMKLLDRK